MGPAIDNEETLGRIIDAGASVIRINFSHGDKESQGKYINLVKKVEPSIFFMLNETFFEEIVKPLSIINVAFLL